MNFVKAFVWLVIVTVNTRHLPLIKGSSSVNVYVQLTYLQIAGRSSATKLIIFDTDSVGIPPAHVKVPECFRITADELLLSHGMPFKYMAY